VLGEVLVEAGGQVKRSAEIIHRIRDFVARGETRKQLVAVSTLIQEGKALVLPDFKSAGIDVVCHLDKEAPYVFADAIQISQVLVNLIRNAVDAMVSSPRRRLTLTTLAVGPDMVAIGVGDSGPGLSEEVRDRLFQPFVSTKGSGMGLGLWLSRSIVEAHDGHLSCVSNSGEGTLCCFTLPAKAS
jgi:two-component system sensor kinase FixL